MIAQQLLAVLPVGLTSALLPVPLTILGSVVLIAIFVILQRLRQHSPTRVVTTTLFWQMSLRDAQPHRWMQRFRRWWSWLLITLIALSLWWAATGVEPTSAEEEWVLVDASLSMQEGRLEEVLDVIGKEVLSSTLAQQHVLLCTSPPRVLVRAGEPTHRWTQRRQEFRKTPYAAISATPLLTHLSELLHGEIDPALTPRVCLVTPQPPPQSALDAFLKQERFSKLEIYSWHPALRRRRQQAITAIGIDEPRSGVWGRVDVCVEVASNDGSPQRPQIKLGDQALNAEELITPLESTRQFLLNDVPARGDLLSASLPETTASVGFTTLKTDAAIRMPERSPIVVRVDLSGALRQQVERLVVASAGSFKLVEGDAEAQSAEVQCGSDHPQLPSVLFSASDSPGSAQRAFKIEAPQLSEAQQLRRHWLSRGISANAVGDTSRGNNALESSAEVISIGTHTQRRVLLPFADITRDADRVVLTLDALRWCAQRPQYRSQLQADGPSLLRTLRVGDVVDGVLIDRVGENRWGNVSWSDRVATTSQVVPNSHARNSSHWSSHWWGISILLLLALEGWLSRSRRIP